METHLSIRFISAIALGFCINSLSAQETPVPVKELQDKFSESRKVSNTLVRDYSWDSRTDVTRDGKVVDILIEHFWYTGEGKPTSRIINDEEAKLPSSFLIHRLAEEMKEKTVDFMKALHVFLQEYALTGEGELATFFTKAVIGDLGPEGEMLVSGNDVIVGGDKMVWYIDPKNYTLSRASVYTTFKGEKVEFSASYKYLSPGINYMAFAEIIVPGRNLLVKLHNYDYSKAD